jgi:hypothetical protein
MRTAACIAFGLCAALAVRCMVRDDVLYDRIYTCSSSDDCGTDRSGVPMTCFPGDLLGGGKRFCAVACDPTRTSADPDRTVCASLGALLSRCHPNETMDPTADCPAGLHCYRTNLAADEGVCLDMPVCGPGGGCDDPNHSTCAAALIADGGAGLPFRFDHLNCLHTQCESQNSACTNGEGCLGTQYGSTLADLCAPPCDGELHCPPNYSCLRATSGPAAANLCVPSLPGDRCDGHGCVLGTCDDTGAGFSVCATPCAGLDALCTPFDLPGYPFVCAPWDGGTHCVSPPPFEGANCRGDGDCRQDAGEFCAHTDPTGQPTFNGKNGECRLPCKSDGTCDPIGGLPHSCLGDAGGCFPGELGVPCALPSECISGLSCAVVPLESDLLWVDAGAAGPPPICTIPCGSPGMPEAVGDPQCDQSNSTVQFGYCGASFCRLRRLGGQPCTRDAQCATLSCNHVTGTCTPSNTP